TITGKTGRARRGRRRSQPAPHLTHSVVTHSTLAVAPERFRAWTSGEAGMPDGRSRDGALATECVGRWGTTTGTLPQPPGTVSRPQQRRVTTPSCNTPSCKALR